MVLLDQAEFFWQPKVAASEKLAIINEKLFFKGQLVLFSTFLDSRSPKGPLMLSIQWIGKKSVS